jgi:predicted methyltransferase
MFHILAGRARVGVAVAALIVPSQGTADSKAAERDAWQKPDDVVSLLQLWPGNVVADIGAGIGHFEPHLAKAVGAAGRVLALDVEPRMVTYLERRVKREKLGNVTVRQVAANDPGLADGSVDRLLVIDTWHHLPARAQYAAAMNRALRPGGFIVVVDFTADSPEGPPARARVSPATVIAELEAGGFSARTVAESLPLQYVVIGQKRGASSGRPTPTSRQRALVQVIEANADRARFTRGVNTDTVRTLEKALEPTDDPELRALLYHDDAIVTRTAASVFAARGDRGLALLREVTVDAALPASNRAVVDDVIWTANARPKHPQ